MQELKGTVFLSTQPYREIFKSVLVYLSLEMFLGSLETVCVQDYDNQIYKNK